ncbi:MAG TPA: twin-arginine translocation signal domain-containing protein, partial [Candidatus Angelobacter sp.]|nr:twin-arginine translocation signal domain-containing protein [Candidatus Angelobacter sp.]
MSTSGNRKAEPMTTNPLNFSRRDFLKTSTAIAAGSALPVWFIEEYHSQAATTKPLSPNEKPNIALIGCGGQGRYD